MNDDAMELTGRRVPRDAEPALEADAPAVKARSRAAQRREAILRILDDAYDRDRGADRPGDPEMG